MTVWAISVCWKKCKFCYREGRQSVYPSNTFLYQPKRSKVRWQSLGNVSGNGKFKIPKLVKMHFNPMIRCIDLPKVVGRSGFWKESRCHKFNGISSLSTCDGHRPEEESAKWLIKGQWMRNCASHLVIFPFLWDTITFTSFSSHPAFFSSLQQLSSNQFLSSFAVTNDWCWYPFYFLSFRAQMEHAISAWNELPPCL